MVRKHRLPRVRGALLLILATTGGGVLPASSAFAASITLPGIRDNVTNAISRSTAPADGAVDKVIGPASAVAPTIGETTAPVNDSAMFRANSALKDQVASDSSGVISNN